MSIVEIFYLLCLSIGFACTLLYTLFVVGNIIEHEKNTSAVMTLILSVLLLSLSIVAIINNSNKKLEGIRERIDIGYVVYVDGYVVDSNNIDITQYEHVTIDDEQQKILVS